jgi:hypothetical protein
MTDDEIDDLLFVDDGPEPADLALVFGYIDPAVARQRASHAAALHRAGYVPRLLLSGGGSHPESPESETKTMSGIVFDLGIPREAVLVEDRSRNTFENVANSVALLRDLALLDSVATVLLVSCPWHMRRVSLIAREGFPDRVRLRCCPHGESCLARSWRTSRGCRERVIGEAELLLNLIEAGVLPDPRR